MTQAKSRTAQKNKPEIFTPNEAQMATWRETVKIADGEWISKQEDGQKIYDAFSAALKAAAKRANLEDYDTRELKAPEDWRAALLEALTAGPGATLRHVGAVMGVPRLDREPLLRLLQGADPMAPYAFCSACVAP